MQAGAGWSGIRSGHRTVRSGTRLSASRCNSGSSTIHQPPGDRRHRSRRVHRPLLPVTSLPVHIAWRAAGGCTRSVDDLGDAMRWRVEYVLAGDLGMARTSPSSAALLLVLAMAADPPRRLRRTRILPEPRGCRVGLGIKSSRVPRFGIACECGDMNRDPGNTRSDASFARRSGAGVAGESARTARSGIWPYSCRDRSGLLGHPMPGLERRSRPCCSGDGSWSRPAIRAP